MNPRHFRSAKFLKGWPKRWAFQYYGPGRSEILVLTSRLAGNWTSLRFLIQRLEQHWLSRQDPHAPNVKLALVEKLSVNSSLPVAPNTVAIIHPGVEALGAAHVLREQNPDLKITIHLSFEPSALMRPFWEPESPIRFRESDLFVVLCDADQKLVRKFYPNAQVKTLHWTGYGPGIKKSGPVTSICYAGRLSPQKNVHLVILAYACALQLRSDLPILELAGKWDNGGNQFEEAWTDNYESDLRILVQTLKLEDRVKFPGHLENTEWENFLSAGRKVFISASLLLDENHGVAPREFIDHGHNVVLPGWGGFLDISKRAPENTVLVNPVKTETSLWLDPWDLASGIILSVNSPQKENTTTARTLIDDESYLSRNNSSEELISSEWASKIQKIVKAEEERRLFRTGPFRAIHFLPELRNVVIDAYAPKARAPGKLPEKTLLLPWMSSERNSDKKDLWEKGYLYSEVPPTASSESTP